MQEDELTDQKRAQLYFGAIIGPNILRLRRNADLTQREISVMLDMQEHTIRRWESGQVVPELRNIMKIAEVLKVKPEALFRRATKAPED